MELRAPSSRLATGAALLAIGAGLTALALAAPPKRVVLAGTAAPAAVTPVDFPSAAPATAPRSAGIRTSYADVLEPSMKAVVNIQSTRTHERRPRASRMPDFLPWHVPEGDRAPEEFDSESLGSGVVVRSDGIILTNNHVVEGADEVVVTLSDRRELRAKVLGTDPPTDIAVLKVEDGQMPALPFGRSAELRVGDIVFAIGSPFGLAQTATMGIVSATGRSSLGITRSNNGRDGGYESFIQTDAAINPGNSGGALIDATGQLVGINTAIYSRGAAGNQGVGFAVPVDLARSIMDQILADGRVVRSRLGIQIKPVDAALAKSFGLPHPEGALVVAVTEDSPAEKAGIEPEDVIVELDGRPVLTESMLRLDISNRRPGTRVAVGVLRDTGGQRRRLTLTATLEELKDEVEQPVEVGAVTDANSALRGVRVDDLDKLSRQERSALQLDGLAAGAIVTEVAVGSPAARAGVRRGNVIVQINRDAVTNAADFARLAKGAGSALVRIKLRRGADTDIIAIEP